MPLSMYVPKFVVMESDTILNVMMEIQLLVMVVIQLVV